MNSLVSVIVPSYNVEKYLSRCIDSLLTQTYPFIEIIIVDDGSIDKTGEIAERYAKECSNVQCLHKKNGGVSDARNAGLQVANGEYVTFLDSDDWIEPNAIEDNLILMIEKKVPVIAWGYFADFVDENEKITSTLNYYCSDVLCQKGINPEVLLLENRLGLIGYSWNKLYRMDLLKQKSLTFPKGVPLGEDLVFNVSVLTVCESFFFNSRMYTHYMQRGRKSFGNRYYDNYLELKLLACDKRKDFLISYGLDVIKCNDALYETYFLCYVSTIRAINNKKDISKNQQIKLIKSVVQRWKHFDYGHTITHMGKKLWLIRWLFKLNLYLILFILIR